MANIKTISVIDGVTTTQMFAGDIDYNFKIITGNTYTRNQIDLFLGYKLNISTFNAFTGTTLSIDTFNAFTGTTLSIDTFNAFTGTTLSIDTFNAFTGTTLPAYKQTSFTSTLAYTVGLTDYGWKNNISAERWHQNGVYVNLEKELGTGWSTFNIIYSLQSEHNAGSDLNVRLYDSIDGYVGNWYTITATTLGYVMVEMTNLTFTNKSSPRVIHLESYIGNVLQYYHINKIDLSIEGNN